MRSPAAVVSSVSFSLRSPAVAVSSVSFSLRSPAVAVSSVSFSLRSPAAAVSSVSFSLRSPAVAVSSVSFSLRSPAQAMSSPLTRRSPAHRAFSPLSLIAFLPLLAAAAVRKRAVIPTSFSVAVRADLEPRSRADLAPVLLLRADLAPRADLTPLRSDLAPVLAPLAFFLVPFFFLMPELAPAPYDGSPFSLSASTGMKLTPARAACSTSLSSSPSGMWTSRPPSPSPNDARRLASASSAAFDAAAA